jgi:hypothetical protein
MVHGDVIKNKIFTKPVRAQLGPGMSVGLWNVGLVGDVGPTGHRIILPGDVRFYDINAQIKNQIFGRDTTTFIDANLLASHLPFANRKSYDLFYYCHKIC